MIDGQANNIPAEQVERYNKSSNIMCRSRIREDISTGVSHVLEILREAENQDQNKRLGN